jgi:hypothetical protein
LGAEGAATAKRGPAGGPVGPHPPVLSAKAGRFLHDGAAAWQASGRRDPGLFALLAPGQGVELALQGLELGFEVVQPLLGGWLPLAPLGLAPRFRARAEG